MTNEAPERIWVCTTDIEPLSAGQAHISSAPDGDATEYIRADALAALEQVKCDAREEERQIANERVLHCQKVCDRLKREARNEALWEAAELFKSDDWVSASNRETILALLDKEFKND